MARRIKEWEASFFIGERPDIDRRLRISVLAYTRIEAQNRATESVKATLNAVHPRGGNLLLISCLLKAPVKRARALSFPLVIERTLEAS